MSEYRKQKTKDFSRVDGGVNFTDDPNQLKSNQVQDCLNAIFTTRGVKRCPGTEAGAVSLLANARGIHIYTQLDGTEIVLIVSNGKLYSLPKDLNTKTELYDMTGSGKAYFVDYLGKCWVTNGTSMVKVENSTTAYQNGITPPSGVSAAATSGGSLTVGAWRVYACYARRVSGSNVLFSVGENLGIVNLTSGNQTIAITDFVNSSDGQVGNKVIFLTEPAALGGVTYFYHETTDNSTTSFNITSNVNRNINTIYTQVAEENTIPTTFEYIYSFDGSIYGSVSNVLYRSIKDTSNVYNLERYTSSTIMPYQIKGIFELGEDLFLNTAGGIFKIPLGDFNLQWKKLTKEYFYDISTVKEIPGKWIIGLTFTTVRIFDGEKFVHFDVGYNVKSRLNQIYIGTSGFSPCAGLRRTGLRLEYHLSYNNGSVSKISNNERLVLNIDKLQFLPNAEMTAPWEIWGCGANFIATDVNQTMFNLQDHASVPKVYKFVDTKTINNGIYQLDGTLGDSTSEIYLKVVYQAYMKDLITYTQWETVIILASIIKAPSLKMTIREGAGESFSHDIDLTEALWDVALFDVNKFASNSLLHQPIKIDENAEGYNMFLTFEQTANDPDMHILSLLAIGRLTQNRGTIGGM